MGIALTEEQVALADSVHQFVTKNVTPERTRAQFEDIAAGMWPRCWQGLVDQGLLGIHLPERYGGDGAGIVELAVVLEEAGRGLVPGPLLSTVLASALVARHGGAGLQDRLLPTFVGGATAAVALSTDGLVARRTDNGFTVSGTSAPVPGALSAEYLLMGAELEGQSRRAVWFVVKAGETSATKVQGEVGVDLTRDIGTVTLADRTVYADEVLGADSAAVRTLAAALHSAEAAGLARWCQEAGLAYVKVREQFGRPVGSFQAIKHKCALLYSRVEMMTAAAWDSAMALDGADVQQGRFAAVAAASLCLPEAVDIGLDTVTLFGGIGYTWEHDVHLYWRRAMVLATQLGPAHDWTLDLGWLAGTVHRTRNIELDEPDGFRAQISSTLATVAALPENQRRAALADARLVAPHYPAPYGLGAGAVEQVIIAQEFARVGLPQPSTVIGEWALPTILAHGDDHQRERFVRPTLLGELVWCQLFSEPGAGSDLASLRTRAVQVEGGWKLDGQKVWTSSAHEADWGICLARTDPDAPKHRGISYFLVDMKTPGLTVRPLREASGHYLFNEVFLDGVVVPDELMVGGPGDGWKLARTTLGNERVSIGSGMGHREDPAALATRHGVGGPLVTHQIGELAARVNAFDALVQRGLLRQLDGHHPGAESSILKVVSAGIGADTKRFALRWVGSAGSVLVGGQDGAGQDLLSVPPTLIGGGTNEIQLNVISEMVLGLPREARG